MTRRLEDLPDLMTPQEAMEFLGVGRRTLYRALHSGEIPSIRLGRLYKIPRVGLVKLLQGHWKVSK